MILDGLLLLFKCIIDTGAEVLRDFTANKIKTKFGSEEFSFALEKTKHYFYHQRDKKNVPCCECPSHGCNIKTIGKTDKSIYEKWYIYKSSINLPLGHVIRNGSKIVQNCICLYTADAIMLNDLDLSELNVFLNGLHAIDSHTIYNSESIFIQEIMTVCGKICHAVNSKTFTEVELTNLWDTFTNALCNLYPGDLNHVKWLKKSIDVSRKNSLSQKEVQDILKKIGLQSMEVPDELRTHVTNECTGIKTELDKTLLPLNELQAESKEHTTLLVTNIPYKCEESKHLSMVMNAFDIPFSSVKLKQQCEKRTNELLEYFRDLEKLTIVGSVAEGLNDCTSDSDMIMCHSKFEVVDSNCKHPKILVLRIPDEGHPGYSKLRVASPIPGNLIQHTFLKDSIFFLKHSIKEFIRPLVESAPDCSINGPAFHSESNEQHVKKVFQDVGIETQLFDGEKFTSSDLVFCFQGTQWPVEASEWNQRNRTSNWPPKELFENITKSGYYLAAVGSKESEDNEIQWRVSFNKAELLIIESFNETQIHCIRLLKIMKNKRLSKIAGNNITSYTMKTVMFWCIEEKSDNFWQPSNLTFCFCFCVSKLKSFVEDGFIPNYFIRDRNQFIASKFKLEIQNKTSQNLDRFLENPKYGISLLLPSYTDSTKTSISELHLIGMKGFVHNWLENRLLLPQKYLIYNRDLLWTLYDGYNIRTILFRCDKALEKLQTISYTQPLIKNLQNSMGFLQYILLREEKKTAEHRNDSDRRIKYSKFMKLSATGDLTHTNLRIATCLLDDGVKGDCIKIIRAVTDSDGHFFMQTHHQRLKKAIKCDFHAFKQKTQDIDELTLYEKIIKEIDFIGQDPYRTTEEFEKMKENGHVMIGFDSLHLAWKQCYFDVTFMVAELPVLPKPAALELCIDNSQKHVSFHPFLYGLLLEFLWQYKYGSGNEEKQSVLDKMKNCVLKLPNTQKCCGLNFMTYCFTLQKDYCSASKCLIQSFKLNPVRENVAYRYIEYIVKLLRKLICDL